MHWIRRYEIRYPENDALPTKRLNKFSTQTAADLSQSLSVGAHVSEDDKHVLLTLVGKELGRRQGQARGDDTLNTV